MEQRKFFNQMQPQTLQVGVMLLYIHAVFAVLNIFSGNALFLLVAAATVAGGFGAYGIANDRKWGYQLGLASAVIALGFDIVLVVLGGLSFNLIISLMFDAALVAVLLSSQTKSYVATWFK